MVRGVLPVDAFRDELLDAVAVSPVLVCVGETGSGKTTQIPQFLADAPFLNGGAVVVTQPRRVAAVSVAHRVAAERNGRVGDEVGSRSPSLTTLSPHHRLFFPRPC